MKKIAYPFGLLVIICYSLFSICSCASKGLAEKRLTPLVSTDKLRMDDIADYVDANPAKAMQLIGVYRTIYGKGSPVPEDAEEKNQIQNFETRAENNLKSAEKKAVSERRWEDAASLARSLANLGLKTPPEYAENVLLLKDAQDRLAKNDNLGAFLFATQSNGLKPLSADEAMPFFKRAIQLKQRRSASFFAGLLEARGKSISAADKAFIAGRDSPQDMIKGVVTVLVNRGFRIERGMGSPDWVLGSAFFVDDSGLLITNYHVISSEVDPAYEGYSRLYIRQGDSSSPRIPAKVIGWDKAMDLALLKTEVKPGYVFSLADWVIPKVGDTVYAIGSPLGLEKTVTKGIVSALGRRFVQIGDVIQIDAAVNHGNSGGPVVDMEGRLVGIAFAGIESQEGQGLNFAIPSERLAAALPALMAGGKAQRPWLGLDISETRDGAQIVYVAPYTPAAEQMVKEGTYITRLNGEIITAPQGSLIAALQDKLFPTRPGELVSLETSDGETKVLMSQVRPDLPLAEAAKKDTRERMAAPLFGMILMPSVGGTFTPTYLIKQVVRGSVADAAGLSARAPVVIRDFAVNEKKGYALLTISVQKRRMGYLETSMTLPAGLDSPDTL
jgi:S1-C subfamily serine protease